MTEKIEQKSAWQEWKSAHAGLWQFVMFVLMSGITTLVDLATFAVFNFWIFRSLHDTPFFWGPIRYSVENGGLTAFGAFAVSFAVSQTVNFFLQRKKTFHATNNAVSSALLYALMVIGVYFLQLYVPTLIRAPIVAVIGAVIGDLLVKAINMILSMLIQFPLNKWVIMRQRDSDDK